jgi:RHS repeat-associated protein
MTVDNFGVTQTIADAQRTYLNGVTFDSRGVLSQINFGNGTSETFTLNDRFQMESQSLKKGAEVLQKYDYKYGKIETNGTVDITKNNGQLAKVESFIGTNKQSQQRFEYDSIGRLSQSSEYRGDNSSLTYKQKFDFDRFGNLYRKAASNPTAGQQNPLSFTPIEDVHISKSTNRFTTNTTYDDAGNVTTDNKFRTMGFAYDANGRQIKATRASVPDAWTVYDAVGNRVATKINDVWQYMVYDAFGKLVAEYGVASEGVGGVKYVQQDWQGSVRTVANNNGFVVGRTDHQAFGSDVGYGVGQRSVEQGYSVGKVARQGYGLTERDDATGLDHTWFRKNESSAGRWTSPDPYNGSMSSGDPQSFNRYSYVQNEPTNFVDPSGLLQNICAWVYDHYDCSMGAGSGQGYYTRTWNINIGDGRTYPLIGIFQTFSGYNGGGRGGGLGDPPDDKAWSNCIWDAGHEFLKNTRNKVTQTQIDAYSRQQRQDYEAYRSALNDENERGGHSMFWVFLGVVVGAALGTLAEPGGGTVIGAAAGGAIAAGSTVDLSRVTRRQINEAYRRTVRNTNENNPEAKAYYNHKDRRKAAEKECDKLLPKGWWQTSRPGIPIFGN